MSWPGGCCAGDCWSCPASELNAAVGEELLSVTEPEFGEITDRGVNFDYLDPDLRPPLREFLKQLPPSGWPAI